jgi:hypothetical protein
MNHRPHVGARRLREGAVLRPCQAGSQTMPARHTTRESLRVPATIAAGFIAQPPATGGFGAKRLV